MDMKRYKRIARDAAPLIGAMISQNLLNLVDVYMIDRFSTEALAAVVAGGIISWLGASPVLSLTTGVQQMSARRYGEGKNDQVAFPLNAGLILSLLVGIPLATVCSLNAESILGFMTDDPLVIEQGVPYLSIIFMGTPVLGMNFCFRGFWNGINKQRIYMFTIFIIHATNIFLNYVLIFGKFGFPQLGAKGAAIGSVIAVSLGCSIYFVMAFKWYRAMGFMRAFDFKKVFRVLIGLSLSNAVTSFQFALSFNVLYAIIATLGTRELAAAGVIIKLALICYLPGMAFGMVATSLVGQSLGRKDPQDADRWARQVATLSVIVMSLLAFPLILMPQVFLQIFIKDPETVGIAVNAVRELGVLLSIEGFALAMQHSLLGAGDSRRVMFISIFSQWGIYIPFGYLFAIILGFELTGIWMGSLLNQIFLCSIYGYCWFRGDWKNIKI